MISIRSHCPKPQIIAVRTKKQLMVFTRIHHLEPRCPLLATMTCDPLIVQAGNVLDAFLFGISDTFTIIIESFQVLIEPNSLFRNRRRQIIGDEFCPSCVAAGVQVNAIRRELFSQTLSVTETCR